ncbi:MAG: Panacea domain-containing protein [Pleomorphochaeta sp.]
MSVKIDGDNNVKDVARYIINYCHKNEIYITNLKLQKLLYFCEALYLLGTDGKRACFSEDIYAWKYGPVVPSVYSEYKIFGSSEIPEMDEVGIKIKNRNYIDDALDSLAKKSSFYLVDLTHSQDPWIDAQNKSKPIISKNSIFKYFS